MSDRSLSSVRSLSSGRSLTKSPKIAPTKNSGAFVNSKETRYAWAMAKPRRSSTSVSSKQPKRRDHSPVRIVGTQKRDAFLTLQAANKRDSLLPPTTRHEFALAATSSDEEGPPPPPPQMVDKTPSNKTVVPTTRTTTTKAVPKETTPPKVVDNKTPPPKIRKRLVLMRHATSYMNEYIGANGITFGGPDFTDIFNDTDRKRYYQDSPLSPKGRQQAEIQSMMLDTPDSLRLLRQLELVVVSPLTRAIQTLELALLPHVPGHVPTVALPLAAERLYLVSDVGKPVSELEDQYGHVIDFQTGFDTDTTTTNDPWWYTPDKNKSTANNNKSNNKSNNNKQSPKQVQSQIMEEYDEEWRPTGQGQRYYCAGEPLDAFEARMEQLVEWLEARPESTICLVGHYGVFEWLLRQPQEEPPEPIQFGNCEMRVVTLRDILDARRPQSQPPAEQPEENEQQQQEEDEMSAVSDASFDTVETATETTFIHSTTTSLNTFLGTP